LWSAHSDKLSLHPGGKKEAEKVKRVWGRVRTLIINVCLFNSKSFLTDQQTLDGRKKNALKFVAGESGRRKKGKLRDVEVSEHRALMCLHPWDER